MIVVTGATGHTVRRVTELLLAQGEQVRAVGRDANKLAPLVQLGAEPMVADVADIQSLATGIAGASAVYLVLPEDLSQPDVRATRNKSPIPIPQPSQKRMSPSW